MKAHKIGLWAAVVVLLLTSCSPDNTVIQATEKDLNINVIGDTYGAVYLEIDTGSQIYYLYPKNSSVHYDVENGDKEFILVTCSSDRSTCLEALKKPQISNGGEIHLFKTKQPTQNK